MGEAKQKRDAQGAVWPNEIRSVASTKLSPETQRAIRDMFSGSIRFGMWPNRRTKVLRIVIERKV